MNKVNLRFIKKLNPIKTTILGFFMWFILFLVFELKVKYPLDFMPMLYIFLNYFFFILGLFILRVSKSKELVGYKIDYLALKKMLYVVIFIACLGILLRLLDKFYIRGAAIENNMLKNRDMLSKKGPSIISIISAITNPFSFIPLFIFYYTKSKSKILLVVSLILFFSASYEYIAMGSRSGIFILLLLFSLFIFYFKKLKLTVRKIIGISILLFFLGIYTINLFISRTSEFTKNDKRSIAHILTKANYNFTMEPTSKTKKRIINSKNKTLQSAQLGIINFVQYYEHGMYEFGYLYNNYNSKHHYGGYTFNIIAKFINIVFKTKIDLNKIQNSPPRKGIYTTFFGPIFIDFGWFSLIFMFFFGVFQKSIYNNVIKGRFQYIPLLFYFLMINFFMPVINFINGAQGLYTITSFIFFALLYTLLAGKIIISNKEGKKQYIRVLNFKS